MAATQTGPGEFRETRRLSFAEARSIVLDALRRAQDERSVERAVEARFLASLDE